MNWMTQNQKEVKRPSMTLENDKLNKMPGTISALRIMTLMSLVLGLIFTTLANLPQSFAQRSQEPEPSPKTSGYRSCNEYPAEIVATDSKVNSYCLP
jgi:hypothetical protein